MLRTLFPALILTLAACELQPAPARSAAPTPAVAPTAPSPTPAPAAPAAGAPADAGVVARIQPTAECTAVGVHVASILIAEAPASQQMMFEQNRDKIVRSTAEVCTTQNWTPDAVKCYATANNGGALRACESRFRPAPPPTEAPRGDQPAFEAGSGGGSGKKAEPGAVPPGPRP